MKIERPTGPAAPDAQSGIPDAGRAEKPSVSFPEALGRAEGDAPPGAVDPAGIEGLVGRLRAGEIGMDAVLDSLVEQAAACAPLGPKGQGELREILRSALENDPTLRRLARELEQG
jgi:hypothetical protein